uniref:Cellular protein AbCp-52 n=1 Tax=Androctonus bicolor TaxID=748906 RepID=A0A0K0LC75_9SCOR|nr:cellular protein AbCp-52 [Androctonus bicolor]
MEINRYFLKTITFIFIVFIIIAPSFSHQYETAEKNKTRNLPCLTHSDCLKYEKCIRIRRNIRCIRRPCETKCIQI